MFGIDFDPIHWLCLGLTAALTVSGAANVWQHHSHVSLVKDFELFKAQTSAAGEKQNAVSAAANLKFKTLEETANEENRLSHANLNGAIARVRQLAKPAASRRKLPDAPTITGVSQETARACNGSSTANGAYLAAMESLRQQLSEIAISGLQDGADLNTSIKWGESLSK